MSRYLVVQHGHHADEGVYRLVYAVAEEVEREELVENPDYRPGWSVSDADEHDDYDPQTPAMLVERRRETVLGNHIDIVWADDDPQWEGLDDEQIATAQRQVVSELISKRISEQERAEAESREAYRDFGGGGAQL